MNPVTIALLMGLSLVACNPQPEHQPGSGASPAPTSTAGLPPLQITGHGTSTQPLHVTQQTGNRKVYELVAKSYTSRSAANLAQAKFAHPTVTFFDKDGTKLTAQAPTASMQGKDQVILSGGVHATTSTGLALTCDTLTYDQHTEMLHGQGHVRITGTQGGQQQMLTGNTFTSDVKLTKLVMR